MIVAVRRRLSLTTLLPAVLLGAALAAGLVACSGGGDTPRKAAGSGLWIAAEEPGEPLSAAALARLGEAGVRELFLAAGRLESTGAAPKVSALPLSAAPGRTPATLVISGNWSGGDGEPSSQAAALAASLTTLATRAREAGWVPLGFHFDPGFGAERDSESLERWGELLAALRDKVDRTLFLSAGLHRGELAADGARKVARAVDFLVANLYGQRPGEAKEAAAWDLSQVEAALRQLDKLGRDYLVEVVTVGQARHDSVAGGAAAAEATTRGSLGELVRSPLLELSHGFTLETIDGRTYRFEVQRPGRVLGWTVARGDTVSVLQLDSHNLEEYRRRAETLDLKHRLGDVFHRLPVAGEGFALTVDNLVGALAPGPARATLALTLEPLDRSGRRYRVVIENPSAEPTDVATLSSNFVEIVAPGGVIGKVDPGEFYRWEMFRETPDGERLRTFRRAGVLRLYGRYLGPGERKQSGVIELSADQPPTAYAEFLLPDGSSLRVEPSEPDGATAGSAR
jgi:hypothetical protein